MTSDILQRIYDYLGARKIAYDINTAYVKGKNPPILSGDSRKNENLVPIPFAKMAVDDMRGYAGRAEDISITFDSVDAEDTDEANTEAYQKIVRKWSDYNTDTIEISELYGESLTQGKAYELFWTTEENEAGFPIKPEWKIVPGNNIFIKYTSDVKPVKEYAVRFWKDNDQFDGIDDTTIYAMVYYPLYAEMWKSNGAWIHVVSDDISYPFTEVPVLEYKCNTYGEPLFEAEKKIIDMVDKIVSKSINEVDRFNALILLLPALADIEFKQKLIDLKVMDDLAQYDMLPQYLEKNLGGVTDFYKWIEELMEKSFRKSIKIPDMTDQSFGGTDESGVAKAYKMLGMEFVAAQVETYFNQGIYGRKQLIDDVINAGTSGIDTEAITINVKSQRNLPVDIKSSLENAALMKGIGLTMETILKSIPKQLVPDWQKEAAEMDSEPVDNTIDADLERMNTAVVKIK